MREEKGVPSPTVVPGGDGSDNGDDGGSGGSSSSSNNSGSGSGSGGGWEMPKLQLFDLVAGGAFERALEGMGRQEGGEVCCTVLCCAVWGVMSSRGMV